MEFFLQTRLGGGWPVYDKAIIEYNDIKKDVDYNNYDEDGNFNDAGTQYLPPTCILDSGHFPALVVPLSLPTKHDMNIWNMYCIFIYNTKIHIRILGSYPILQTTISIYNEVLYLY